MAADADKVRMVLQEPQEPVFVRCAPLRARPVPTCPAPAHSLSECELFRPADMGERGGCALVRVCRTRYLLSFVFVFDNEQDTCAAATAALPYPHPFHECSPMARRR